MPGVEILLKDEPYYIPGYSGTCPQHEFNPGRTFGDLSYNFLRDPKISHADKLALVDNSKEHEAVRPRKTDLEVVKSRHARTIMVEGKSPYARTTPAVYDHPMCPSYKGFVPKKSIFRDKPKEIIAVEGIANFERDYLRRKAARDELKKSICLQSKLGQPAKDFDENLVKSKFKFPLVELRPERAGAIRNLPISEEYSQLKASKKSPYFMPPADPQKFIVHGFTGYIPFRSHHVGKTHKDMSREGLKEFTSRYLHKKMTDWAPVSFDNEEDKILTDNGKVEIYRKDTAILSTYGGHIPGVNLTVGKTLGSASKETHFLLKDHLFKYEMNCKCKKLKMPNS